MGGGNVGDGLDRGSDRVAPAGRRRRSRAPGAGGRERHPGRPECRRRPRRAFGCRPIRRAGVGPRSAGCFRPTPPARAPSATAAFAPLGGGARAGHRRRRESSSSARRPPAQPRSRTVERFEADAAPAILAAAEQVRARFPRTRKNASGYALDAWLDSGDLLDLLIGAEGTLGFVTAAEWRLDPRPAARAGPARRAPESRRPGRRRRRAAAHEPSAVELLDRTFLELVGEAGPEAVLLVEIERDDEAAAGAARRRGGGGGLLGDRGGYRAHSGRGGPALGAAARGEPDPRGAPREPSLASGDRGWLRARRADGRYSARCARPPRRAGLAVVIFGHAGDGHVHVNLLPELRPRPGWEDGGGRASSRTLTDALVRLGGTRRASAATAGSARACSRRIYGDDVDRRSSGGEAGFDPLGIPESGVILPDPAAESADQPPQGRRARRHASRVARGLRRIEQLGGYAQSRAGSWPDGHSRPQP